MSGGSKPSVRIDWFDGSIVEETRLNTSTDFADEDLPENPPQVSKPQHDERKPIGFKRLLDISLLKPPILTLEVTNRPGFWNLFDQEDLKGDFIVLIVRILANVCKDIQPDDKSKVATLLRTRFLKSQFLEKLNNYLLDLPSVRVVQKRMNSQLWDDVESFYCTVLDLIKGVLTVSGEEMHDILHDLLEVLEISALGVIEEHSERFTEKLFQEINVLKAETKTDQDDWKYTILAYSFKLIKSLKNLFIPKESLETESDPNHYKELNIFPSRSDIFGENLVKIKPNIVKGAYTSTAHYVDLQFKLLREDYFAPLREGICKYKENPSKRRHENIRVYPQVRILRTYICNNKVGQLIDLVWDDRRNGLNIQTYDNKQLMYGTLLLFTNDNFNTILCATVLDSNSKLLKEGYLVVSFQNPISKKIFTEPYLMVESEVFFEPYHRVLNVLQNMRIDQLPMKKYIVDVKPEISPPAYLNNDTIYTVKINKEDIPFPVLDTNQWPKFNDFDNSQFEAFKFALTREFAVIQGPPGTGKTFIGVKIASTLLKNLSLEGTPMLIICYTNHALDQFLEGILKVTDSIVRLGSRSKSKILEPYSLRSVKAKSKCKYSYLYAKKRSELERIYKELSDIETEIEKCENNLVSYDSLRPYLKINGKNYELAHSTEDPVDHWLFEHLTSNKSATKETIKHTVSQNTDWRIQTCFSHQLWAEKEIENVKKVMKHVSEIDEKIPNSPDAIKKFDNQINMIEERLKCYKNFMATFKSNQELFKIEEVNDLYELSTDKRWQVYYNCLIEIITELLNKMDPLLEQYNTTNNELEEISSIIDSEVMSGCRVVGATTTAAARRHNLMKKLNSTIVIVEEAAEVLEAHIVASLTRHCQHLILIGDHKQLRPTAAHYELAKNYNLEISLFERMISNGLHARTLTTQRRMRPNIAELLVPIVYERLDSHPSVFKYDNVRGIDKNLFFYRHEEFEDTEGLEDSWSHKNLYEAKWCVSLANYLRQIGYKPDEITILSTYLAQVGLITKLSEKYELLRDVKITAVDNFQGEESRIVILSLVRSNRDGNIGFLTAANRICVALSRAKEGFYIFGNMKILKSASPLWRAINKKLTAQNAIGNYFTLFCEKHRDNRIRINSPEELDICLSGKCLKICEMGINEHIIL